ncbi:605_t:CDS:2, partial [Rhizophagus irregularis]
MSLQTSPFFNLYDKRVEEVKESFEEHDEVLAHLEYVKSEVYKNETKFTSVNATGRISIRTSGHNFFTEEPNIGNMS